MMEENRTLAIALTKTTSGHYPQYAEWLRRSKRGLQIVDLENEPDPLHALRSCAGLVLVGGADVDPVRYGETDAAALCRIDAARDHLEFTMIDEALKMRLPILGVCRGLQVMNVVLGGSLIPDLPSAGFSGHGSVEGRDARHPILVESDSLLGSIVRTPEGRVNSAHHQGAGRIATPLRVTAVSPDGVAEALEWKDPRHPGFLLLMQWHPERHEDQESPFARAPAVAFLNYCIAQESG